MKRGMLVSGVILFFVSFVSCQTDEDRREVFSLQKFSCTECASDLKSVVFDNEYVECSFVDGQTMHITLYNININCGVTDIKGKIDQIENNNITVNIETSGESANCICDRSLSFDLFGLTQGVTYLIDLKDQPVRFEVKFAEDMGIVRMSRLSDLDRPEIQLIQD